MAFSEDYLQFVLDQLEPFGEISHKKMFGGVGIYKDGIMFAGIMGGTLHFKVNDSTRQDFIDRGMEPFYHGKMKKGLPSYYMIPEEILEDRDALTLWAKKAFETEIEKKK